METVNAAAGFLKEAAPYAAPVATVASAALPLFMQDQDINIPEYTPANATEIQKEATEKADLRRRELARRRGQASTIRTPLGVAPSFGVRRSGITGV